MSRKASLAEVVLGRIQRWSSDRHGLWNEAKERSAKRPAHKPTACRKKDVEVSALAALRIGDVKKALQVLNAAPFAPKDESTLIALRKLHPEGKSPSPTPLFRAPVFTDELVKTALCSFGAGSAAGLFGYKPFLLQQCLRAESFSFLKALSAAVNQLADGRAPQFLQPYLAGGVSIALAKPLSGVRPLCCGDPIRRLVGKCFCIGGKDEISAEFKGKNFGVGCPGGVEVVAHSLRDSLERHSGSNLALLKIDFRTPST